MEQLLKYGLQEDKLKQISEVSNGLSCNCVCAKCKHPLIAKNNPTNKKMAHFAHHTGTECLGAYETTLHLLAKITFEKTKQIILPDFHFDYNSENKKSFFKIGEKVIFDEVLTEATINTADGTIIPDAVGKKGKRQLLVEFANTHFVGNDKKRKIENSEMACIEIDLANVPMEESSMIELFNSYSHAKYWIKNPRLENQYLEAKEKEKMIAEEKKMDVLKRFNQYRLDKNFQLLQVYNGKVKCPKAKKALGELKKTNFYRHIILKRIIDGEFWNGEIYGRNPNGSWIFLKGEKTIIYPANINRKDFSEQQRGASKMFWAGLMEIKSIFGNNEFGDCVNCKYSVEKISVGEDSYEICKHPF